MPKADGRIAKAGAAPPAITSPGNPFSRKATAMEDVSASAPVTTVVRRHVKPGAKAGYEV